MFINSTRRNMNIFFCPPHSSLGGGKAINHKRIDYFFLRPCIFPNNNFIHCSAINLSNSTVQKVVEDRTANQIGDITKEVSDKTPNFPSSDFKLDFFYNYLSIYLIHLRVLINNQRHKDLIYNSLYQLFDLIYF